MKIVIRLPVPAKFEPNLLVLLCPFRSVLIAIREKLFYLSDQRYRVKKAQHLILQCDLIQRLRASRLRICWIRKSIIEVREIDSVIRLKSGNVAILGGLMETRAADKRTGPAGSERMPILGHALGAQKGEDS